MIKLVNGVLNYFKNIIGVTYSIMFGFHKITAFNAICGLLFLRSPILFGMLYIWLVLVILVKSLLIVTEETIKDLLGIKPPGKYI